MNNFDYKNMTPFKWFVLENFPFIENDFDAINNYHLFSKVVEYLNKTIDNMNLTGEQMENVTNAMTELQNYVNNYFDNLDVQEEINNKLDEMTTDGTLENIINQEIFGEINNNIDNINTTLNNIYNKNYEFKNHTTIMIGDSYGVGITSGGTITGWCDRVKTILEIPNEKYFKFVEGGSGFVKTGSSGNTFLTLLENNINNITNKNDVTTIIVCGGYNDNSFNASDLNNAIISFMNYVNQNFPNAKVFCGMVGNSGAKTENGAIIRKNLGGVVIRCYQNIVVHGGYYLNGIENIMKDYLNFMSDDNIHPNELGYKWLSGYIVNALITGHADYINELRGSNVSSEICNEFQLFSSISNNLVTLASNNLLLIFNEPQTIRDSIDLGNVTMAYYRGSNITMSIPVKFYLQTTNQKFYGGLGSLKIHYNGNVQLLVQQLANNGDGWIEVQNVDRLFINGFNYTLPSSQC